jgi:hypothetical protein
MSEDSNFLERIMELGIGISVARQMPDMLTRMMPGQNPSQPAGQVPPQIPSDAVYYMVVDNAQAGPFSDSQLQLMAKNGILTQDTLVWKAGMSSWQKAATVPEINKLLILSKL